MNYIFRAIFHKTTSSQIYAIIRLPWLHSKELLIIYMWPSFHTKRISCKFGQDRMSSFTDMTYMGDSLEKGTKTVTRSSVAMRTPETIACFTRPQLSGISVKLVQCDQIYESPTLNKTLGTYLNGYHNHRHYIFRVICIRNLLRVQIKWRNTRSSLAPSHGHQLRKHRCGCRVSP